jgi:ParB family chromosome partitioning protein
MLLARAMKKNGMLLPLIVRSNGRLYELVAGSRRYRAAVLAGFEYVDVMILNTDRDSSLALNLAEKLTGGLNYFQQGQILRDTVSAGMSVEDISEVVGMSCQTIIDKIRLLAFDAHERHLILQRRLPFSEAVKLLELSPTERSRLFELPQEPKICGFVRNGSILTQPIVTALKEVERAGVKCHLDMTETDETVEMAITLHKKM